MDGYLTRDPAVGVGGGGEKCEQHEKMGTIGMLGRPPWYLHVLIYLHIYYVRNGMVSLSNDIMLTIRNGSATNNGHFWFSL